MSWFKSLFGKKEEAPPAPAGTPPAAAPSKEEEPKGLMGAFYRRWKDPFFLKQLKTLAAYMQRDGVDVKDRAQVQAWLEKNKADIDAGKFKGPPPGSEPGVPYVKTGPEVGRNDPCPCGSGKKYKKCCAAKP